MWWLAQQPAPSPGTDLSDWLQFGVLGLVLVGILTGWLWAKPAVERLLAENDRLRHQVEQNDETIIAELHELRREVRGLRDERP